MRQIRSNLTRLAACLGVLWGPCVHAAEPAFIGHEVERHYIDSKNVAGQRYEITVVQPYSRADGSERFAVLYVPDANFMLGLVAGTTGLMQNFDLDRFIIVGIGYPEAKFDLQTIALRQRDLTPTFPKSNLGQPLRGPKQWPIRGVVDVPDPRRAGGAKQFLKFLHDELFPLIDARYPTQPGNRAYFGSSYGGLFGLYVMLNRPETFTRYVIGSPSTGFDADVIFHQAEEFIASGKPLNATVYLAGGGLEPNGPPDRVVSNETITDFYRLHGLLESAKIPGLNLLPLEIFAGETHYTVPSLLYVRGIRKVFGPPQCALSTMPWDPKPAKPMTCGN